MLDDSANELWNSNVGKESDPWKWGTSSSPVVHGDLVIITASAESQAIVGLDKQTGKEVWRQEAEQLDEVLELALETGTVVISNAGGVAPRACAEAIHELLRTIDLEKLSPMDAFMWLMKVKKQLED